MGGFSINSSPEKIQQQLDIINASARKAADKEAALKDQEQTNADVKKVKDYLYYDKDQTVGKDAPYSRFRDPSGAMAREKLESRGVDTDSMITGRPSANEDYKKGGMTKSSASSRADGCCKRGHTKGKYL
jgi:hypothetical protein